jgi:hypothetical protein
MPQGPELRFLKHCYVPATRAKESGLPSAAYLQRAPSSSYHPAIPPIEYLVQLQGRPYYEMPPPQFWAICAVLLVCIQHLTASRSVTQHHGQQESPKGCVALSGRIARNGHSLCC